METTTTTTTKPATVCTVGPDEIRPCAACRNAAPIERSYGCNKAMQDGHRAARAIRYYE